MGTDYSEYNYPDMVRKWYERTDLAMRQDKPYSVEEVATTWPLSIIANMVHNPSKN